MHQLTQWQQDSAYDAYNPNQIIREPDNTWGPGATNGISSFYFSKQPTTVQNLEGLKGLRGLRGLKGLAGSFSFTTLDPGVQMLVVGLVAGAIGFFGLKFVGPHVGIHGRAKAGS